MKLNLRIKDKIFIFIVGIGLLLLLINGFYSKETKDKEEEIMKESENEIISGEVEDINNSSQKEGGMVSSQAKVFVASNSLEVSVAKTELERYQGLSNKDDLEENKGMLFLFDNYGNYGFVMRNMNFSLDFVFVRDDEVIDLKKNVQKDFSGEISSLRKYNKVLEVRAGWIKEKGILIGDKVEVVYF